MLLQSLPTIHTSLAPHSAAAVDAACASSVQHAAPIWRRRTRRPRLQRAATAQRPATARRPMRARLRPREPRAAALMRELRWAGEALAGQARRGRAHLPMAPGGRRTQAALLAALETNVTARGRRPLPQSAPAAAATAAAPPALRAWRRQGSGAMAQSSTILRNLGQAPRQMLHPAAAAAWMSRRCRSPMRRGKMGRGTAQPRTTAATSPGPAASACAAGAPGGPNALTLGSKEARGAICSGDGC